MYGMNKKPAPKKDVEIATLVKIGTYLPIDIADVEIIKRTPKQIVYRFCASPNGYKQTLKSVDASKIFPKTKEGKAEMVAFATAHLNSVADDKEQQAKNLIKIAAKLREHAAKMLEDNT